MDREGKNKESMRKYREWISLHFLILSPFPLHFLTLSPFFHSQAGRLAQLVQPCLELTFFGCYDRIGLCWKICSWKSLSNVIASFDLMKKIIMHPLQNIGENKTQAVRNFFRISASLLVTFYVGDCLILKKLKDNLYRVICLTCSVPK